jgi:hypothetical protein
MPDDSADRRPREIAAIRMRVRMLRHLWDLTASGESRDVITAVIQESETRLHRLEEEIGRGRDG